MFGPSPEHFTSGESYKSSEQVVELAKVGDGNFTDLELIAIGERSTTARPQVVNHKAEAVGTLREIHFSPNRKALIGILSVDIVFSLDQVVTEFTEDRKNIARVVIRK